MCSFEHHGRGLVFRFCRASSIVVNMSICFKRILRVHCLVRIFISTRSRSSFFQVSDPCHVGVFQRSINVVFHVCGWELVFPNIIFVFRRNGSKVEAWRSMFVTAINCVFGLSSTICIMRQFRVNLSNFRFGRLNNDTTRRFVFRITRLGEMRQDLRLPTIFFVGVGALIKTSVDLSIREYHVRRDTCIDVYFP